MPTTLGGGEQIGASSEGNGPDRLFEQRMPRPELCRVAIRR
jgi:hypothetical protein